jgi:hypothetical protein
MMGMLVCVEASDEWSGYTMIDVGVVSVVDVRQQRER